MKMNPSIQWALGRGLMPAVLLVFLLRTPAGADAWEALQHRYAPGPISVITKTEKSVSPQDPWARLRAVYLPFSETLETEALTDPKAARRVSGHLHKALGPYASIIGDASRRFRIPPEIIGAVIMAESGGNPRAQASGSTAKGLMQTISGTFRDARENLLSQGILIEDDPFDPAPPSWRGPGTWIECTNGPPRTAKDRTKVAGISPHGNMRWSIIMRDPDTAGKRNSGWWFMPGTADRHR
jgi:hypothetical protein